MDYASRALDAHVEYLRRLTTGSGGTVVEDGGVTCFVSPHPMPFLVNVAVRTDPAGDPGESLLRAQDFFSGRGRGYQFLALDGRDDDLLAAAGAVGHAVDPDRDPVQALTTGPLSGFEVADLDLRRVTDAGGVHDYTAVCVDAHAAYGFPADFFPTIFTRPEAVIGEGLQPIVGYEDDRPVASATVLMTGGAAYLGWVAVVRDRHRAGLGAGITAAATNLGLGLGADAAVLMASPMGAPVYRRMGYVDVGALRSITPPAVAAE